MYQILSGKYEKKVILGHTDVNGRIILKWFLKGRQGYVLVGLTEDRVT